MSAVGSGDFGVDAASLAAREDAERRKDAVRAALDTYLFAQNPLSFPVCCCALFCVFFV